jgi:hypothetical protein
MGEVSRARDTNLRDVAIKILPRPVARNPERRARFECEVAPNRRDLPAPASLHAENCALQSPMAGTV